MSTKRFVLLDRDGTIISERCCLSDYCQVELLPDVVEGLHLMCEIRLGLVIITNQSGLGRGYFTQDQLELIHKRMRELLLDGRVELDGIFYCPHMPEDHCRKPKTGLIENDAKFLDFNCKQCFVIGDKPCGSELGTRAGTTTFPVRTGYGADIEAQKATRSDYVVDDLLAAALEIREIG